MSKPTRNSLNSHRGRVAEQLVKYRLMSMEVDVLEAPEGVKYDLVAIYKDVIVRIQVKSSTTIRTRKDGSEVVVFAIKNKTTGVYSEHMYDVLALVDLDKERVLFKEHIPQHTSTLPRSVFNPDDEENSWVSVLDMV